MKFKFVVLQLLFFFVSTFLLAPSFAQNSGVVVNIGKGELKIKKKEGEFPLKIQNQLRLLQTDLLVDSNLSNRVLSSRIQTIVVEHNFTTESISELKSKILSKGNFTSSEAESNDEESEDCLLYTSPSPRDRQKSRMPSSA